MISKLEIVNRALVELGINRISSFDDMSTEAKVMSDNIEWVIDSVFSSNDWSYSQQTVLLSPSLEVTPTDNEYSNAFELPASAHFIREIRDTNKQTVRDYRIEGRFILSNEVALYLFYVGTLDNMSDLPVFIAEVIVYTLAESVAYRLTKESYIVDRMRMKKEEFLHRARVISSRQKPPVEYFSDEASGFMNAHFGNGYNL